MDLNYIKGVNLGNWLVLEKSMNPALFDGTTADDEYYLPTQLDPAVYEARIRTHRAEYINERDFATIKSWGLNSVRIRSAVVLHLRRPRAVHRLHRRTRQGLQLGREIRPDHPYRSAHRTDEPKTASTTAASPACASGRSCPTKSNSCCPCSNASPSGTAIVGR